MIQTKILDLKGFKKIEDVCRELDNLSNNEGFILVCCAGKKNHLLILQRVFNYPQPQYQQQYMQPPHEVSGQQVTNSYPMTGQQVTTRGRGKKKQEENKLEPMFPNAVYR